MEIGNIDFVKSAFWVAGMEGFFKDSKERRYPKLLKLFSNFFFKDIVFVTSGVTINSSLGLLKSYKWQGKSQPFVLSFIPTGKNKEEKIQSAEKFAWELSEHLSYEDCYKYAVQVDFCYSSNLDEIFSILEGIKKIYPNLILIPKFNYLVDHSILIKIKEFSKTFCILSNLKYKNVARWISQLQELDESIKLIIGNRIMNKMKIRRFYGFKIIGGIVFDSIPRITPWMLQEQIDLTNFLFEEYKRKSLDELVLINVSFTS